MKRNREASIAADRAARWSSARIGCPNALGLLPGLPSAPLEKRAGHENALALERVQLGERGGVEVRRGGRLLGGLAVFHWEGGKVTDRHNRRVPRDVRPSLKRAA